MGIRRTEEFTERQGWYSAHIGCRDGVQGGWPCIKGTRMPVRSIVAVYDGQDSMDDVFEAYPHLTEVQVQAALDYYRDNAWIVEADFWRQMREDDW